MIKLESAHIEEMRGIRKLDIDFHRSTFAISGPNGSGKSGVIDAVEFGLTGQIGRLTGRGTKGLSISEHGPHVDKAKVPDASFVELRVFLPTLQKSATITRKVSSPNKPKIVPADDDVKAVLAEIADHPEIMLSRREILRFILVEPAKRSEEIQAILKLDDIGDTRAALNTAQNKLQSAHRSAEAQVRASRESLQVHLQIPTLRQEDVLEVVNRRRKSLGLPILAVLTADTRIDSGLSGAVKAPAFNKQSTLADLGAFTAAMKEFAHLAEAEAAAIVAALVQLEADAALMDAFQRHALVEAGLKYVEGSRCPLCDTEWEDEKLLRSHLESKLAKSQEARKLREELFSNAAVLAREAQRVAALVSGIRKIAESQADLSAMRLLGDWKADLDSFKTRLATLDGLVSAKERLSHEWVEPPATLGSVLQALTEKVQAQPDQTDAIDAQTFLTTGQVRLSDYREAMRRTKAAEIALQAAKAAYDAFCSVMEEELNRLYDGVQEDFSAFYRVINEEDEATFTAKLTPTEGKLDFNVNFYERGLYPPGAYHSEGHQDGMGVCLYLALMKRLFGDKFTFALLDDVVMSVDAGHRYQFCKLLKTSFPDTQFLITTHDRLWAEQMRSAGLVTGRTSIAFHSWTIDSGPLVESNAEIWDEISSALNKGKVEAAAAALRRHLEYISRHLADQLGASPQFRADGNYELGDLLPSVLTRMKAIFGKAADAAQSWGNEAEKDAVAKLKASLSASSAATNVEQWAVNKAVHYNEWANFGKKDFEPVVAAFKELLACFRCESCESWLHTTPRVNPEALRCLCNARSFNLKVKPKS